jgi:hypothetical protein
MPERDSYTPGTPSWVDLGTSDIDGAVAFYEGLLGWSVAESQPDTGGYRLAMVRDRPVAGLMPLMSEQQPVAWTTYVAVDDADAAAASVSANGGQVVAEPMDVMELGRMSVFMDPAGAALGVWQANQFPGAGLVNEPGAFTWNELATRDIDAAHAFYPAVLPWTYDEQDFGGMAYTLWKAGDQMVAGGMPIGDEFPAEVPNYWAVYFAVDDADATAAKVPELGGTVMSPPRDIPDVGRFAVITDPQGGVFSILKAARPAA